MNQAMIPIVVEAVREKYGSERAFYSQVLGISPQSWDRFKKGDHGLKAPHMQKIAGLFTDYEWMLVQKVCRNASLIPQVASDPLSEFRQLKFYTASQWIGQSNATMEWHPLPETTNQVQGPQVLLRICLDYGFWSYQDIIELRLPSIVRQQIEGRKLSLLEWQDLANEEGASQAHA